MTDSEATRDEIQRANAALSRKPEMGARYMRQAKRNLGDDAGAGAVIIEAGRLAREEAS